MQRHLPKNLSKKTTPQSSPASKKQIKNSAGGYSFKASNWDRLLRFLILGTEGGTYYISEKALTLSAGEAMQACWEQDQERFIKLLVDVSSNGRAQKNDPAIFALAYAFGAAGEMKWAINIGYGVMEDALLKVCRTGTDILHFCEFAQSQRGWGRALTRAVARWYGTRSRTAEQLAYQLIKYRQRDGWAQRDALRMSHPVSRDPVKRALFALAAGDYNEARYREALGEHTSPLIVEGFLAAQRGTESAADLASLVRGFSLTREMLPTEALNHAKVWEALLLNMPPIATIRNLGNMSKLGVLKPLSPGEALVLDRLTEEPLKRAKVHPLQILAAARTYASGRGLRGSGEWPVNQRIVDALDKAFPLCFQNAESTGLNIQVACDVSGSMGGGTVGGIPGFTPREAAACLALLFARREPQAYFTAFSDRMVEMQLGKRTTIDSISKLMTSIPMGGTDCSLPMRHAQEQNIRTDLFIVLTDSETWHGDVHPHQALKQYRAKMSMPHAKLVVVGMVANQFTIADPDDPGMLDVVGFDAGIHSLICNFASS